MSAVAARALFDEARSVARLVRQETATRAFGSVLVSGILADQLAKELGAGAAPGAIRVGSEPLPDAEVVVRIIAGEPTPDDDSIVRDADRRGVEVVLVQLWPQADWTRPYVLSPHVVECRAGEGFPIRAIGDRIVDAAGDVDLAAAVPTLAPSVERRIVTRSVVRTGAMGLLSSGGARRPITLEQLAMVFRLTAASRDHAGGETAPAATLGAIAGGVIASGLVLRGIARSARQVAPASLVDVAVAAAGTWAIARAARAVAARASS